MIRLAHIKDGYIVNVSLHKAGEPLPADTMLESEAIATGYERITTPVDAATLYPPAEMWQVKVWMVRNGIDLASIPGIMAASIPAGPQLQEALVRWETAPLVPFDNALVGLIAGALNISKETAWNEIRAI